MATHEAPSRSRLEVDIVDVNDAGLGEADEELAAALDADVALLGVGRVRHARALRVAAHLCR